jgi:hypothetical protein
MPLARLSSDPEAEHVNLLELERVDEAQHVPGHVGHVVGPESGRGAHAAVVEQDDVAILGEAVDQCRVPVVEVAAEVLPA